MPNRILKESICTSENIDQLSLVAETAFYRLIVNCDDYGRMDGRLKILKSRLFPLKSISEDDMGKIIHELENNDLISTYVVNGMPYIQMRTWDRHQQVRAKKSKYPSSSENICNQLISDDSKCHRNPIQSESESISESESESEPLIPDQDAIRISHEHDQVLSAAENAGFGKTEAVRAKILSLFADYGMEKMLYAIDQCVQYGAINIAYLKSVLNGDGKKPEKKSGLAKTVIAHQYTQNDYTGVQEEVEKRFLDEARKAMGIV